MALGSRDMIHQWRSMARIGSGPERVNTPGRRAPRRRAACTLESFQLN
jgi:hypothetical protein